MENKIVSFKDENGNSIDYSILEQKLINKKEYILMAPVNNKSHIEVYKINFDKDWNESLQQVDSEVELNMIKQVSSIKF